MRIDENVDTTADLVHGQEEQPQTHHSVRRITHELSTPRSCVHDVIKQDLKFDMDELKHRLHAEWSNLDHAVVAAAIRHWRRRLSACVKAGAGHFKHCF